jgi:MFS transporter, Spinster family, sphingosine-1-phosphate transporter
MTRRYGWYVVGLLTVVNFVNYVDRMVIATMYDDLRREFGFSNGQLGALSTAFFVVHAAATLPFGWAADRFDRRKVMAVGVILWSLATLGSAYALGFASMFFLRGMVGVGEAAYGPASNAILCEVRPEKKAALNAIYNGGMFAGACAGLWLGGYLGFPLAFEVVALPGFVLGFLVLFLAVTPHRTDLDRHHAAPSMRDVWRQMVDGVRRTLRIPTLRWMLGSGIFISFASGGYVTWIVDFTVQVKGMSQADAAPFYALVALTGGVGGVLSGGFIADRWQKRTERGRVLTIALGFLCAFPFCICVMLIDHGWPYYITGWLLMFFLPFYNGPMAAVIDDVVDDDEATTAQASFVPFLHILGTGSASVVVGYVSQIPGVGLRGAFALPAGATLIAGLLAIVASRHVGADMAARRERMAAKRR